MNEIIYLASAIVYAHIGVAYMLHRERYFELYQWGEKITYQICMLIWPVVVVMSEIYVPLRDWMRKRKKVKV